MLAVDDALHNEDEHAHAASDVFEMSAAVRIRASMCKLEVSDGNERIQESAGPIAGLNEVHAHIVHRP